MKILTSLLLIAICATGCITLRPGIDTQARVRGYNGRNAGEIQGSQSLTIQIQLPNDPAAAAAAARGLGPISQVMGNQAPVAQHFDGGGVQADTGGGGGWLSGLFSKKSVPPDPAPAPPVAAPAEPIAPVIPPVDKPNEQTPAAAKDAVK